MRFNPEQIVSCCLGLHTQNPGLRGGLRTQPLREVVKKETNPSKIVEEFCQYFFTVDKVLKENVYPLVNFIWREPATLQTRTFCRFRFGYVSVVDLKTYKMK